jgi:glycerophosphoryl diester phosphodiesterase
VPFLEARGPVGFAHRGYCPRSAPGIENSLAAFEHAVALGYDYLETDARVTRDGVVLAFHDHRLDRVTDRTGVLAELDWSEVGQARIGGVEPIPALIDVLDSWPQLRFNIDVKSAAAIEPTVAAITRAGAQDRVCVAAFSDRRLHELRARLGSGVCTALGPVEVSRLALAARLPNRAARSVVMRSVRGRCAQIPASLARAPLATDALVRTAHQYGIAVHVWTINDRVQMEGLLDLGVDGVMTDEAEILKDVMTARGLWR